MSTLTALHVQGAVRVSRLLQSAIIFGFTCHHLFEKRVSRDLVIRLVVFVLGCGSAILFLRVFKYMRLQPSISPDHLRVSHLFLSSVHVTQVLFVTCIFISWSLG